LNRELRHVHDLRLSRGHPKSPPALTFAVKCCCLTGGIEFGRAFPCFFFARNAILHPFKRVGRISALSGGRCEVCQSFGWWQSKIKRRQSPANKRNNITNSGVCIIIT
jgi:hypothetical protein